MFCLFHSAVGGVFSDILLVIHTHSTNGLYKSLIKQNNPKDKNERQLVKKSKLLLGPFVSLSLITMRTQLLLYRFASSSLLVTGKVQHTHVDNRLAQIFLSNSYFFFFKSSTRLQLISNVVELKNYSTI